MGWPGMGMVRETPWLTAPGKIWRILLAAASAFGVPPCRQSSNSYRDCRTGLEKATLELSTKVMCRTPHPSKILATAHPRVPAANAMHADDISMPPRNMTLAATVSHSHKGLNGLSWASSKYGLVDTELASTQMTVVTAAWRRQCEMQKLIAGGAQDKTDLKQHLTWGRPAVGCMQTTI